MATQRQVRVRPEVTREGTQFLLTLDVYDFSLPANYVLLKTLTSLVTDLEDATIQALVNEVVVNEARLLDQEQAPAALLDDFATDVILPSYMAEYKGNSLGQLHDYTGNGLDLTLEGAVANPVIDPPEGDAILLELSVDAGSDDGDYLAMPIGVRPPNAAGHVSLMFRVVHTPADDFTVSFLSMNSGGIGFQRYLSIRRDAGDNLNVNFTDENDIGRALSLPDASAFYDGNWHTIVVSWNVEALKTFIDGAIIAELCAAHGIDLGIEDLNAPYDYSIGYGFDPNTSVGVVLQIDDVIISNREFVPPA